MKPKHPWTNDELNQFDHVTMLMSSRDQCQRIQGRLEIKKLVEAFGKQKCDAMFGYLQARDKKQGRS